jgi:lambdaSa04 family prophage resolvase
VQEGVHVVEDVILGHLRPVSGLVVAQGGVGDVFHPAVTAQHLTLLFGGGAGLLRILASRDQVDELVDKAVRAELDTTDLHIEADQLFARVGAAAETIDQLIARNARVAQNQGEYQRRFDKLTSEHATLLEKYHRLLDQISDLDNRQAAYHHYREELDKLDIDHIEFTPYLWHTLVDHAEIGTDGTITFTFRDGRSQEISLNK